MGWDESDFEAKADLSAFMKGLAERGWTDATPRRGDLARCDPGSGACDDARPAARRFGIMTPLFDLTEVVHAAQEVCPRDLRPMPFQGVAESVLLQQRAHRGVVALARRCIGNALRLGSCIHQTGTDHLGPLPPRFRAAGLDGFPGFTGCLHGAVAILVPYRHGFTLIVRASCGRFMLLTMTVEAKIKVITCWSLSDRTNRKGDLPDGEADQRSD
jgi:hypothetical protein